MGDSVGGNRRNTIAANRSIYYPVKCKIPMIPWSIAVRRWIRKESRSDDHFPASSRSESQADSISSLYNLFFSRAVDGHFATGTILEFGAIARRPGCKWYMSALASRAVCFFSSSLSNLRHV